MTAVPPVPVAPVVPAASVDPVASASVAAPVGRRSAHRPAGAGGAPAAARGQATPRQLLMMCAFGLLWQACASGRWAFAAAAWLCLLPLAVFVRAARLPVAVVGAFAVVFVGRLAGLHGVVADAVATAATAATLTTAALLAYRHVMRELPRWGSISLPAAMVVGEALAAQGGDAPMWALWRTQAADVPLWRFVDVVTPAGITFAVAWAQSAMAGFGESWIVEDPHDQATRERGLRVGANLCFASVFVVGHVLGFLRGSPATVPAPSGAWAAALAVGLVGMLGGATLARRRRAARGATG
jgi:hypothetical protein